MIFCCHPACKRVLIIDMILSKKSSFEINSGFSSERTNLSPFTKDFRGEEHSKSVSLFISARACLGWQLECGVRLKMLPSVRSLISFYLKLKSPEYFFFSGDEARLFRRRRWQMEIATSERSQRGKRHWRKWNRRSQAPSLRRRTKTPDLWICQDRRARGQSKIQRRKYSAGLFRG